ncbi:MAG: response regulator [Chloroflexi bacterium]|nr:response regulator [Chloroflexota bacterium]
MLDWNHPETWSVLIVEDESDNAEVVSDALKFMGATVRAAANGRVGLEMLQEYAPDLILLDLSMPYMDGWEMHRRLRADPHTRSIVVVALSAHAMMGDKERVLAAGFDGYLSKPVSLLTFVRDLHAAVESAKVPPAAARPSSGLPDGTPPRAVSQEFAPVIRDGVPLPPASPEPTQPAPSRSAPAEPSSSPVESQEVK